MKGMTNDLHEITFLQRQAPFGFVLTHVLLLSYEKIDNECVNVCVVILL